MKEVDKNTTFRMVVLITTPPLADLAAEMYQKANVPVHYRAAAAGTAPSEMLDILGLGSTDKIFMFSIMPTLFAHEMLHKLKRELKIGTVNSGIAFTMPLSGANSLILKMFGQVSSETHDNQDTTSDRKDENAVSEMKYSLIVAVVNQGYSDMVADVAREAGASGGTVLHGRRAGNDDAISFWGLSIQEEKDIVLIVADVENKLKIIAKRKKIFFVNLLLKNESNFINIFFIFDHLN
jgi:hypothetical protein